MLVDQMVYLHGLDYTLSIILQEIGHLSKSRAFRAANKQFGQVAMDTRFDQAAVDIQFSSDIIERKSGFDNKFGLVRLDSLIVKSRYPASNQLRGH